MTLQLKDLHESELVAVILWEKLLNEMATGQHSKDEIERMKETAVAYFREKENTRIEKNSTLALMFYNFVMGIEAGIEFMIKTEQKEEE